MATSLLTRVFKDIAYTFPKNTLSITIDRTIADLDVSLIDATLPLTSHSQAITELRSNELLVSLTGEIEQVEKNGHVKIKITANRTLSIDFTFLIVVEVSYSWTAIKHTVYGNGLIQTYNNNKDQAYLLELPKTAGEIAYKQRMYNYTILLSWKYKYDSDTTYGYLIQINYFSNMNGLATAGTVSDTDRINYYLNLLFDYDACFSANSTRRVLKSGGAVLKYGCWCKLTQDKKLMYYCTFPDTIKSNYYLNLKNTTATFKDEFLSSLNEKEPVELSLQIIKNDIIDI